jgi:hypothetical protein
MPEEKPAEKWELVSEGTVTGDHIGKLAAVTEKMTFRHGTLYRTITTMGGSVSVALAWVPRG